MSMQSKNRKLSYCSNNEMMLAYQPRFLKEELWDLFIHSSYRRSSQADQESHHLNHLVD